MSRRRRSGWRRPTRRRPRRPRGKPPADVDPRVRRLADGRVDSRPAAARPPTMAGCRRHPPPGPPRRTPPRPCATVSPATGMAIVVGSAALFGTLGPLSRFAYDAGMEPPAFVTWRALVGLAATAAFVVWRIRRGDISLARWATLPGQRTPAAAARRDSWASRSIWRCSSPSTGSPSRWRSSASTRTRRWSRVANTVLGPRPSRPTADRRAGPRAGRHGRRRRLAARPGGRHPVRRARVRPGARRGAEPDGLRRRQPRRLPDRPDRAGDGRRHGRHGRRRDPRLARHRATRPRWSSRSARPRSCRCCCSPASSRRPSRRWAS